MNEIAEAFRLGGVWMYGLLAIAFATHPLALASVIALFSVKRSGRPLQLIAILCALGAACSIAFAALGWWACLDMAKDAIRAAAPEYRQRLMVDATEGAMTTLVFGLCTAIIPTAAAAALFVRSLSLPKR